VIFALRPLRDRGCILADEVGLGKTIEAGLVIAQSRAEGAQRILIIVPKSLIGQWQNELANLFAIQALDNRNFVAPGIYLVGRDFAGSEHGAATLGAAPPFDLIVIDEAHEIFAGLHKRYSGEGLYDDASDEALMGPSCTRLRIRRALLVLRATGKSSR
jgi:superfamily II DNA or RNA helicase